jgi:3-oxoacyl-[acyl-carrier-protein] synthase II
VRQPDFTRRVVVTGLGVISPVGNDKDTAWASLVDGRSGLAEITKWDASGYAQRWAGEVHDFQPTAWMDAKAVRRSEPALWYGVAAAKQAVSDSGLEITDANREDVGVVFGSGAGGQSLMIDNGDVLREKGPGRVAPTFIANGLVDATSGMIAIETGAIGHNICVVTACSTGTNCVGEAAEIIRRGDVHTVITGSTEMPLLEVAHAGFGNMRGLGSPREGMPHTDVSRPFDRSRDGFVLGEGAASLILEDLEYAKARGARIYAEVVGFASAFDRDRSGAGLARAIRAALAQAGVGPQDIDHVSAHGLSTAESDAWEARGLREALAGCRPVPVFALKSYVGNLGAGGGPAELAASVLALANGVVPPTLNYEEPDPECPLQVTTALTTVTRPHVLKLGFTDMGQCAAVVCRKWEG